MKRPEPAPLLIVEDDPHISLYLESLIGQSSGFYLYGSCRSGEEALELLTNRESLPSMAVVDLGLPGMQGTRLIPELLRLNPSMRIVVFTVFEEISWILASIEGGAMGYILKDTPPDRFLAELEVIRKGGATLTPSVAAEIIRRLTETGPANGAKSEAKEGRAKRGDAQEQERSEDRKSPLSEREREVLDLMSLGFTYRDIADEMNISSHTVRRHIEKIYQKLQVNSRSQAIRQGKRFGWIP